MSRHPQQITSADTALDDDMKSRIIKYSITMTIRTLCFVAAYFAFISSQQVLMWVFVAGAVLLPYPAVIFANAGRERSRDDRSALIDSAPLDALPPGRGETISEDGATVIDGETIDGETVDPGTRTTGGQNRSSAEAGHPASSADDGREHLFTADIAGEVVDEGEVANADSTSGADSISGADVHEGRAEAGDGRAHRGGRR